MILSTEHNIFMSHPAARLVGSLTAANQEISPELSKLAMKDGRFRKGTTRQRGGRGAGAGERRRQQVAQCVK